MNNCKNNTFPEYDYNNFLENSNKFTNTKYYKKSKNVINARLLASGIAWNNVGNKYKK